MFVSGGYVSLMALAQRPDVFKVNTFITILSLCRLSGKVLKAWTQNLTKFSVSLVINEAATV